MGLLTMPGVFTVNEIKKLFGSATCNAKTRAGGLCQNAPMANGRCRMHGGKSLRGIASPRYKHGRYSKDVLGRLVGEWLAAHPTSEDT
jgi:hypothetical protein